MQASLNKEVDVIKKVHFENEKSTKPGSLQTEEDPQMERKKQCPSDKAKPL